MKYDCRKADNLTGRRTLVRSFVRNVGWPRGANPHASKGFGSLSAVSDLIQSGSRLPSPAASYQYKASATYKRMMAMKEAKGMSSRRATYLLGTMPEASLQR